jgi:hypothetical protein
MCDTGFALLDKGGLAGHRCNGNYGEGWPLWPSSTTKLFRVETWPSRTLAGQSFRNRHGQGARHRRVSLARMHRSLRRALL